MEELLETYRKNDGSPSYGWENRYKVEGNRVLVRFSEVPESTFGQRLACVVFSQGRCVLSTFLDFLYTMLVPIGLQKFHRDRLARD